MVHDRLFCELVLGVVLWLGLYVYLRWQHGPATKPPPLLQPEKPPQTPTSFAGLTQKPSCSACEQGQVPGKQSSPSPPPLIVSKRGRPRTVDTRTQYCPQKTCLYYGWAGQGNIRANGHPGSRTWRQFHCVVCDTYFLETHGTPFYGKPRPDERLVRVVSALAEGLGLRAAARVFAVDPNTVLTWLREAADQLAVFSCSFLRDVKVNHVQLDELFVVLGAGETGQGSDIETSVPCSRAPHWVWVAIDPVNKLLLALDVGERTLERAQRLVQVLSQSLHEDERNHHFLLSTQPTHRTAPPAFGTCCQ
jgi:transposase-like protein